MLGKIFELLLDKIYPVRCAFCGKEEVVDKDMLICPKCVKCLPYTAKDGCFDGGRYVEYLVSPLFYKDSVRDAIIKFKFSGRQVYDKTFAALIYKSIQNINEVMCSDLIIPVPLSKKRFTERGYNQSALLAKELSRMLYIDYDDDILIRTRNTKRQSKVSLEEKHNNVRDAFASTQSLEGKRVLLIDDIYTTGATMNECARVLKTVGCDKVYGASIAAYPRVYKTKI